MTYLDNMLLHELYNELDKLEKQRKDLRKYRQYPEGVTLERALQDIDEDIIIIQARIEELEIVQEDYSSCE